MAEPDPPKVQEFRGAETYTTVTVSGLDDIAHKQNGEEEEEEGEERKGATNKEHGAEDDEDVLPEVGFPFRAVAGIEGGKELMKNLFGNANKKQKFKPKAHWNRKQAVKARKRRKMDKKRGAGGK